MVGKEQIKVIISEYQDIVCGMQLNAREYRLDDGLNYVFVGVRRAGKSFLMYQQAQHLVAQGLSPERILYFNFEDDRLGDMQLADLDLLKTTYEEMYPHRPVFFLDEIQNVDHWEKFVRRLADQQYRVYVTGSNAKMLSREIATTLGGRFVIQSVFPYSFREYLRGRQYDVDQDTFLYRSHSAVVREFNGYLHQGGLPETQNAQDKRSWLSSLYNKIFFGDIVSRYGIRNDYALKVLVRKMAESVMQPSSYRRLTNIVSSSGKKVSTDTVIDYVGYLQESWLVFAVSNFNDVLAEQEKTKKYYFVDNGVLALFLMNPEAALLENLVAIELLKRHPEGLYYYSKNVEVDFYVPEESLAVQVCLTLNDADTRQREAKALVALSRHLEVRKALIVTMSEEEAFAFDGLAIQVLPVWKWLLAR